MFPSPLKSAKWPDSMRYACLSSLWRQPVLKVFFLYIVIITQFDSICYSVRHLPKFVSLDSSEVFMFFLPSTSNSEDCHDKLSRVCFTCSHSPLFLMHIHKRSEVLHHLGRSPHDWYTVVALRRRGQIFRTAGFIHPLLETTQNSLLFVGFKPISTVPAQIAVDIRTRVFVCT